MTTHVNKAQTAYDFTFNALVSENQIKLADYNKKVILIVNTASQCGFTKQYKSLESLYQKYKDNGLVVIGVPSNDFGTQEPGTNIEIAKFCDINYGVTFPMTAKYSVKGDKAHSFYVWVQKELGFEKTPKWNFYKYLINRQGKLVDYFDSKTDPLSSNITIKIQKLLEE